MKTKLNKVSRGEKLPFHARHHGQHELLLVDIGTFLLQELKRLTNTMNDLIASITDVENNLLRLLSSEQPVIEIRAFSHEDTLNPSITTHNNVDPKQTWTSVVVNQTLHDYIESNFPKIASRLEVMDLVDNLDYLITVRKNAFQTIDKAESLLPLIGSNRKVFHIAVQKLRSAAIERPKKIQ